MAILSLLSRLKRRVFPQAEAPSLWGRVGWVGGSDYAGWARRTKSGERVDHSTAMTLPTYWACLTGIAADIAKVPVSAVRRMKGPDGKPRGRETLYDHPATRLLDEDFNPDLAAFTGRETLTGWALGWGDGYAEIQRDARGVPLALWPIHPSRIPEDPQEVDGVLQYKVRSDDLKTSWKWDYIPAANMLHIRGYGDGLRGMSVLKNAAESIGLALGAQTFASSFFGNGLAIAMVAKLKVPLDDVKLTAYRKALAAGYVGADKAGGVLVSNGDADFERMSINPDEAQVLESRTFSVPEICRWFRRSPQKVGHSDKAQGWGTLDALQVADTTDCLMPWWIRWEQEARRKLLDPADRSVRVKHWIQALMRGEPKTRAEVFQMRITSGTITPNEVRELEDEEPVEEDGADSLWMQGAMAPIERLKNPPAPPAPPAPGGESPDDPEGDPPADAAPDSPPIAPAPKEPEASASASSSHPRVETSGERGSPTGTSRDDGATSPPSVWLRPLFDVAAARIVSKECLSVGKRVEKSAPMDPWASEFYAKQRTWVAEEFLPAVTALACAHSGPAHSALFDLASSLWKDPSARTAEAFRTPERDLAAALASLVFDTCCAALARKEAA